MRNSRGNSAVAPLASASSTWPWTERRSLAIALLLSLALHVLLLLSWHARREGAPLKPALVVRLTGAFIAPHPPQVVQPPPAPASPPRVVAAAAGSVAQNRQRRAPAATTVASAAQPTASASEAVASAATPASPPEPVASAATPATLPEPVASAATAESPPVAVASGATPQRAPASAIASSDAASEPASTDDLTFYRPDQLSQGPVPTTHPAADRVSAAHLTGRRLVVTVFVDAQGAVRKAVVAPYEISPQQAEVLQEAVAAVRFTPANIDGKPVAAQVQSRLCFDDGGLLDTSTPGCWQFNPQPAH